jgi:hypothetical protein
MKMPDVIVKEFENLLREEISKIKDKLGPKAYVAVYFYTSTLESARADYKIHASHGHRIDVSSKNSSDILEVILDVNKKIDSCQYLNQASFGGINKG